MRRGAGASSESHHVGSAFVSSGLGVSLGCMALMARTRACSVAMRSCSRRWEELRERVRTLRRERLESFPVWDAMNVSGGDESRTLLLYIIGSMGDSSPNSGRFSVTGWGTTVSEPLEPTVSSPLPVEWCLSFRPRFSLLLPLPLPLPLLVSISLRCQLLLA
jgi:hypothetical protein